MQKCSLKNRKEHLISLVFNLKCNYEHLKLIRARRQYIIHYILKHFQFYLIFMIGYCIFGDWT